MAGSRSIEPHRTTVRLTGIRLREQGTHDSFCAYYAAAMLLCALRPEFDDEFDATHVKRDPLFRNLPRRGKSLDRAVADWLTAGVHFGPLARALATACGDRTRYRAMRAPFSSKTLRQLRQGVDRGLPAVLGWESRELGNHTVVVVGYERYEREGTQRWLRVLDPTGKLDILDWAQLPRVTTAPADIIVCTQHDGVRPDRMTIERDKHDEITSSRVERWNPPKGTWDLLVSRKT
jgi:hypothetical protein